MASPKAHVLPGLGLLLLLAVAGQSLCAETFMPTPGNVFRYIDRDGRTVYNSHVPAEYVGNGYTVLNARGQVIEVIPRAKTAAEIAAREATIAAEKALAEAHKAQEDADQLLIRLYRSPDEINRKRDNLLGPINAQIGLLQGNLVKASQAMGDAQTIVDNYSKAGKEPPDDVVAKVTRGTVEVTGIQSRLTALLAERTRIMADAERDSSRLRALLGIAEQTAAQ